MTGETEGLDASLNKCCIYFDNKYKHWILNVKINGETSNCELEACSFNDAVEKFKLYYLGNIKF